MFLDHADSVLTPYQFKMEEIEGFRYRCRVSVLVSVKHVCIKVLASLMCGVWASRFVGRHALGDQAGGEGGPAEGDQTGAAELGETQGESSSHLSALVGD